MASGAFGGKARRPGPATAGGGHGDAVRSAVDDEAALGRAGYVASWRRSLLHHRIDPEVDGSGHRLDEAAFHANREASGLLLSVARPVLERLARVALDAGCAVLLTDAQGVVLDERVRPADAEYFHGAGLAPGTDWSERSEGTNGIGTALAEARPVVVFRDQHFRTRNIGLTCMGAPVFGPEGELAGVIDVSSARADVAETYARLVALTVQDAAQRVEADLFRASFKGARILSTGGGEAAAQGVMLLAIDRDDLIVGATRAARRHLGLDACSIGRMPASDLLEGEPAAGLAAAQRAEMARALARRQGNVSAAARDLGIGRATFYRKAKSLGLTL